MSDTREAKHSPLPWRYEEYDEAGESGLLRTRIADAASHSICHDEPYYQVAPSREDMAFIVEAVNAHHRLLNEVEQLEAVIDDLHRDAGRIPQDADPTARVREENRRLRAALRRVVELYAGTDGWKYAYSMAEVAKAALEGREERE